MSLNKDFSKWFRFFCLPVLFSTLLLGCGDSSETTNVYEEDEMAKYRSSEDQIAAGVAASSKPPSSKEIREIAKDAVDSAKEK